MVMCFNCQGNEYPQGLMAIKILLKRVTVKRLPEGPFERSMSKFLGSQEAIKDKQQQGGGSATSRPKETKGRNSFFMEPERAELRSHPQGAVVVHTNTAEMQGQGRTRARAEMQQTHRPLLLFPLLQTLGGFSHCPNRSRSSK